MMKMSQETKVTCKLKPAPDWVGRTVLAQHHQLHFGTVVIQDSDWLGEVENKTEVFQQPLLDMEGTRCQDTRS